eukprot:2431118-Rhodomonas_salina.1
MTTGTFPAKGLCEVAKRCRLWCRSAGRLAAERMMTLAQMSTGITSGTKLGLQCHMLFNPDPIASSPEPSPTLLSTQPGTGSR